MIAFCVAAAASTAANAAESNERTLSSGDVAVTGAFEEDAVLTVSKFPYTASALDQLVKRKQVANEKSIVGVYHIQISGEEAQEPSYRIVIKNVRLSQFVKNKISVIDENGVYHAVSNFSYVNQAVSFRSPALGEIVIYKDATVLYIVISSAGFVLVFILIAKLIEAQHYKDLKTGKLVRKQVREHDRKYW
jgi:hypothetical protein